MYQNYLDYTHDACMNLFTQGQATYMNAVIGSSRPGLLTAVVCERPLRADFSASDTIVVTGATMQFNDNSIGVRATNWQWTFEGGFPATSSLQNPVVQFTQPGRYAVTLTVSNGTLSDTRIKTSYIFVTYGEPRVYPNPAQDFVIIDLPADYEVKTIVLLNALGQPVRSGIPKNATLRMSLAGLANGIYYVRVMQKNGPVAIKKVLVLKE
jgi:PKD repeat protein